MCASYGLGGGRPGSRLPDDLEPLSEPASGRVLAAWMRESDGRAMITGRKARNLNPLIMANRGGVRRLELGWWWLWLDGAGPARFSAFNSRDDRLMRTWRGPFQHRALLPAAWYVEKKTRFELPGGDTFAIAAVTSTVIDDSNGHQMLSYSMVTRAAVGEAAETWPRMPLVLPSDMHDEWLSPDRPGNAELVAKVQLASTEISGALIARQPGY